MEPSLAPLLVAMRDGGQGHVVEFNDGHDLAEGFRRMCEVAGLKRAQLYADDDARRPITWHDLRHTYCTWLAARGESAYQIMAKAGHRNLETSQRYVTLKDTMGANFGEVFPKLPEGLFSCANFVHTPENPTQSVASPGVEPGRFTAPPGEGVPPGTFLAVLALSSTSASGTVAGRRPYIWQPSCHSRQETDATPITP